MWLPSGVVVHHVEHYFHSASMALATNAETVRRGRWIRLAA